MSTPSSIEVDKNGVLFVTDSGQRSNVRENAKPMSGKNSISFNESKIKKCFKVKKFRKI